MSDEMIQSDYKLKADACEFFRDVSPENPRCGWCIRFSINLDAEGRICSRCRNDAAFVSGLKLLRGSAEALNCDGESSWCDIFDTATDAGQCERCQTDPEFRNFLYGQATARRREKYFEGKLASCPQRGEYLRSEKRTCCGGKTKVVPVYECALHGAASEDKCRLCLRKSKLGKIRNSSSEFLDS